MTALPPTSGELGRTKFELIPRVNMRLNDRTLNVRRKALSSEGESIGLNVNAEV